MLSAGGEVVAGPLSQLVAMPKSRSVWDKEKASSGLLKVSQVSNPWSDSGGAVVSASCVAVTRTGAWVAAGQMMLLQCRLLPLSKNEEGS